MSTALSPLLAPLMSSAAMRAICDDASYLQYMLDFEAALARAEAAVGVIPASAVGPIEKACKADMLDVARPLGRDQPGRDRLCIRPDDARRDRCATS